MRLRLVRFGSFLFSNFVAVLRFCLFHFSLSLGFTGAPFWLKAAVCQSSIRCDRCVRSLACFARVRCVRFVLLCCVRVVFVFVLCFVFAWLFVFGFWCWFGCLCAFSLVVFVWVGVLFSCVRFLCLFLPCLFLYHIFSLQCYALA